MIALLVLAAAVALAAPPACPPAPADAAIDFGPRQPLIVRTAKGDTTLSIELAKTPEQRARGLMHRPSIAPDEGMLFDFGPPAMQAMWMKNTCAALDMIWINAEGEVVGLARGAQPYSLRSIPSPGPVAAVLEVAAGRAHAMGVKPGDAILHPLFAPPGAGAGSEGAGPPAQEGEGEPAPAGGDGAAASEPAAAPADAPTPKPKPKSKP